MKIALVHDFLLYWGGAERVLRGLGAMFPKTPIYTIVYKKSFTQKFFPDALIKSSFLQRLPFSHQVLSPLFPTAIESLILDDYDVVISSGTFAKGIIVKPGTLHIHYCHTPARFLWEESHAYLMDNVPFGLKTIGGMIFHMMRLWDRQAAERPDQVIANSRWTQEKIKKWYRRDANIIHPFLDPLFTNLSTNHSLSLSRDYFLIVSRLQRYKRIELAISLFNKLNFPLYIVGTGSEYARLKEKAKSNIHFLGFKDESFLPALYHHARALILPGIEDFGLTPLEAMSQGTPVLAYRKGGAKETIIEGKTGEFFDELTPQNLYQGFQKLLEHEKQYNRKTIARYAQKFSFEKFKEGIERIVSQCTLKPH